MFMGKYHIFLETCFHDRLIFYDCGDDVLLLFDCKQMNNTQYIYLIGVTSIMWNIINKYVYLYQSTHDSVIDFNLDISKLDEVDIDGNTTISKNVQGRMPIKIALLKSMGLTVNPAKSVWNDWYINAQKLLPLIF